MLKVSEIFYSLQGEGKFTGVPSVFLRLFGCNFTCSGFGMPRGELSSERLLIDPKKYTEYNTLPLVETGCDSYASWDPRFKHLSPKLTIDQVAQSIVDLLPNKKWGGVHLIITGGEPLMKGWQPGIIELLNHPLIAECYDVTFETNGTQELTPSFSENLVNWESNQWKNPKRVTFSVSAKLPCSGHAFEETIHPDVLASYTEVGDVYLKFVVASDQDVIDAETAVKRFEQAEIPYWDSVPVYLMPIGGTETSYNLNKKAVAEAAMERGWRFSDRLQVALFKNGWGT